MAKKRVILGAFAALLLSACTPLADEHINHIVRPESLLDFSSERVTFGLTSGDVVDEFAGWVDNDQPTRAELACDSQNNLCAEAEVVLTQYGIPFERVEKSSAGEVVLFYERLVTRDCKAGAGQEFVGLGCSVSANTVQMVKDHRQFVSPTFLDQQDAESAAKAIKRARHGHRHHPVLRRVK